MPENIHDNFIQRCFDLARLGTGMVAPNPMVGAVIVHNGQIIGEGWHQQYGGPHAEVNAVASVHDPALLPHSTLYCSLEPCHHFGKTPPCVDLILQCYIPRVVIANTDPNPLTAGKSIDKMRAAGVEVITGVLEAKGKDLLREFYTWIEKKRPCIVLKWAQSQDGFIAIPGQRTAISGPATRRLVHRWRSELAAIFTGTQTAVIDNPQLDARFYPVRHPIRITIDKNGMLPVAHHFLDDRIRTIIFGPARGGTWKNTRFVPLDESPFMDLFQAILMEEKLSSVLVEGGTFTLNTFLNAGLFDEIRVITAPAVLGAGITAPVVPGAAKLQEQFYCSADNVKIYTPRLYL